MSSKVTPQQQQAIDGLKARGIDARIQDGRPQVNNGNGYQDINRDGSVKTDYQKHVENQFQDPTRR